VIDIPFRWLAGIKSVRPGKFSEMVQDKNTINTLHLSNPNLIKRLHVILPNSALLLALIKF